jgi:uncharacterized protein (TIGR03437 family)
VTWVGTTAVFTPLLSLTPGTTYTATITNGAQDLSGNALAGNYVWSFTSAPASTSPILQSDGTVNGASFLAPLAPGGIAGVFGTNLSVGQASALSDTPLPTTLAESSFTIGGFPAPLFFAMPGQVNLQIPWELAGQTQASIVATVNGVQSNPETISLGTFGPGIFSINASGAGQGAVLIAPGAQLAAPGTPVSRGAYVSIFCTGLGAVTNQPATGVAATANPLSQTITVPTVTIGGIGATVSFSGLAPGFAGLYQVNAVVPFGVTPGNAVPVVMGVGNASSNTVTIAVQ